MTDQEQDIEAWKQRCALQQTIINDLATLLSASGRVNIDVDVIAFCHHHEKKAYWIVLNAKECEFLAHDGHWIDWTGLPIEVLNQVGHPGFFDALNFYREYQRRKLDAVA